MFKYQEKYNIVVGKKTTIQSTSQANKLKLIILDRYRKFVTRKAEITQKPSIYNTALV